MVFGSIIGVAGKDLFSDGGIDLLIESLMGIKCFSSAGGALDWEEVDWVFFWCSITCFEGSAEFVN